MQIAFSKSLYLREAVERAAVAYAAHMPAKIEEDGDDLIVRIEGDDFDESIVDNFANHVLFETVQLRQRTTEAG